MAGVNRQQAVPLMRLLIPLISRMTVISRILGHFVCLMVYVFLLSRHVRLLNFCYMLLGSPIDLNLLSMVLCLLCPHCTIFMIYQILAIFMFMLCIPLSLKLTLSSLVLELMSCRLLHFINCLNPGRIMKN